MAALPEPSILKSMDKPTKQASDDAAPRIVPVFPLPNTVFFPLTSLPLHVFEQRYREMVRDVAGENGRIAVALAAGDEFHAVGTVGRIRDLELLDDGRYNLRLEGLDRVKMTEVPCDTAYRQVLVEARPEYLGIDDPAEVERAKLALLAELGLLKNLADPGSPTILLHQDVPLEVAINTACAELPVLPGLRQELLEESDLNRRQARLTEHLAMVIDAISQLTARRGDRESLLN